MRVSGPVESTLLLTMETLVENLNNFEKLDFDNDQKLELIVLVFAALIYNRDDNPELSLKLIKLIKEKEVEKYLTINQDFHLFREEIILRKLNRLNLLNKFDELKQG